jgi:hypothetical protein
MIMAISHEEESELVSKSMAIVKEAITPRTSHELGKWCLEQHPGNMLGKSARTE